MQYISGTSTGLLKASGSDKHGRWVWSTMQGAGTPITFISGYRVSQRGDVSDFIGTTKIAAQEAHSLMQSNHPKAMNPRDAFLDDLGKFIMTRKRDHHRIFLAIDANTAATDEQIAHFGETTGLVNLSTSYHGKKTPPVTYARGRLCIDLAFTCHDLYGAVESFGYDELFKNGFSDHRSLRVGFNRSYLFGKGDKCNLVPPPLSLNVNRPKQIERYKITLRASFREAKLNIRLKNLHLAFQKAKEEHYPILIQRANALDQTRIQLMKAAEKESVPRIPTGQPFSAKLVSAGKQFHTKTKEAAASMGSGYNEVVKAHEDVEIARNEYIALKR